MRRALSIILALLPAVAAVPAVAHPVLPDTITLTSDATADTGFQALSSSWPGRARRSSTT